MIERDPASYRDPAGFVYRRNGQLLRQINPAAGARWEEFSASVLAANLTLKGRLISHQPVEIGLRANDDAVAVVAPEEIPFLASPYEWTFGQLKDAALLTLDVQLEALDGGWSLRDASAFNVAFRGTQPTLIDSLSFERYQVGKPWVAYRQYCEHFLAPLALMAKRDVRLGPLLRTGDDGVSLDLATKLLPSRAKANFGLLTHLYLHARSQRRHQRAGGVDASLSKDRLRALITHLRSTVAGLDWTPRGSEWADYALATSYSDAATHAKGKAVARLVQASGAGRAWDLGANTGTYTSVIADLGLSVVALDIDPAASEQHYRSLKASGRTAVLPIVADLADPTPNLGWAGRARPGLMERADADIVVALALLHHLAIGRNVPIPHVVELFAQLAPWALVEFVPKSDPMAARMLASRADVFADYDIARFRAAAEEHFEIIEEMTLEDSERVLLLLRRRHALQGTRPS